MRSRSRSRDRASFRRRSRSRSPRSSRPHENRRDKDAPFIKKERSEDKYRSKVKVEPSKVKNEPVEEESKKFGRPSVPTNEEEQKEPEKPSFELSGNLMQDTNVFNGVVIK